MTTPSPTQAATLATASQADIIKMIRGLKGLDQMAKLGATSLLAMMKPADFDKLRGTLLETLAVLQMSPRGLRVLEGLGIVEFARSVAPCGCGSATGEAASAGPGEQPSVV